MSKNNVNIKVIVEIIYLGTYSNILYKINVMSVPEIESTGYKRVQRNETFEKSSLNL